MNVEHLKRVYFIGIGGIGMSALARFFSQRGTDVRGYDRTETPLTKKLVAEGIEVHYDDDTSLLDKDAELVVYTPAIPVGHKELNWYKDNNYPVYKRSDVLQWITEHMFAITIAGTHGKTTMTTMISYLLREAGVGCNAFLGGVSVNYDTNYWSSKANTAVIEADEYDRSFLKLKPDVALLTAMDADHLDIYGTVEGMEQAYIDYTKNIKQNGTLIAKHGLKRGHEITAKHILTYSMQNDAADVYGDNIMMNDGGYVFDVFYKGERTGGYRLDMGGMHNVENAIGAIAVTNLMELDQQRVIQALAGFRGVKRRFEYVVKTDKTVYVDDYAHHPEELHALIKSAKLLFSDKRCVVVFQPHLYSRTRDLADGFAHSLDMADEVILLDIYPAREEPIEGVTSEMIKEKMANPNCTILSKEGLLEYASVAPLELFITAGAGDIDKLVTPIKEIIESK
ncbi:MAG: UDP-N-acetylmuramate--L-alanine ligase [Chitinophagales bacterium]|nr:UDP-N-acetylmuramate--L-alanine ligase [Chitinophagaceae bacterium]MCB9063713.1 UDP-N-acetylmuramate--L-alanine ligase [Chitinophagales bacterium]